MFDEETQLYYLRSRFLSVLHLRFLNADTIVRQNVFCYCFCNPINYDDESGHTAKGLVSDQQGLYDTNIGGLFLSACIIAIGSYFLNQQQKSTTSTDSLLKNRIARETLKNKGRQNHHIVAQNAPNASYARSILAVCDININHPMNIVTISYDFHRVLHRQTYYGYINTRIIAAYYGGKPFGKEKEFVEGTLLELRGEITLWDQISGII